MITTATANGTVAMQMSAARRAGRIGGLRSARKRRRTKAAAAAPRRRKRRATAKRTRRARLVKGSAAAKRYMAKIRRKRKRA